MSKVKIDNLLEAGVHFGHLTRKWHPNMAPYIFMEKNNIHIIDLNKTAVKIEETAAAMKQIAKSGKKILFVATKKQAKQIIETKAKSVNMPYVTERWTGGMLTNFATVRKSIKKMSQIDRMATDGTFENMSKRERLMVSRQRAKLERDFGSIADLTRLPSALFIIDIKKEHISVAEAKKLNIPTFAMVDTNSNPNEVDFVIPSNDDASKSIEVVLNYVTNAIAEGLEERKTEKPEKKDSTKNSPVEVPIKSVKEDVSPVKQMKKSPKSNVKPDPIATTSDIKKPPTAIKGKTVERVKKAKISKPAKKSTTSTDDLKKIEGIGPKIAEVLTEEGIGTFADLAQAKPEAIAEILVSKNSRYKMHDPTTWPKQAKLAADGKWEDLKKLQDELDGGKKAKK